MAEASSRRLADRYLLREPIGVGGMGRVWRAYDEMLRRDVAVKELRLLDGIDDDESESLRRRAMREAQAAAGLDHPSIIAIHDVLVAEDRPWIVMPLITGRSLDQEVRTNGPLRPDRVVDIGLRLLEALTVAHDRDILHRDIKPQNVMLTGDGRAILTDFGIAAVAGSTRLTSTGAVVGTLGYIAPERLTGQRPGPPSDLWSLGATLYYAVEGRPAYDLPDAEDPLGLIGAVLVREPALMRLAGPLEPLLEGLLRKDPERRLNAPAARERLLAIGSGRPTFEPPSVEHLPPTKVATGLPPATNVATGLPPATKRSAVGWGVAIGTVVILVGLGWWLIGKQKILQPERFTTTPDVCASLSRDEDRLEKLVPNPVPQDTNPFDDSVVSCSWDSEDNDRPDGRLTVTVSRFDRDGLTPGSDRAAGWLEQGSDRWATDNVLLVSGIGDNAFHAYGSYGDKAGWGRVIFQVDNVTVEVNYTFRDSDRVYALPANRTTELARELEQVVRAAAR